MVSPAVLIKHQCTPSNRLLTDLTYDTLHKFPISSTIQWLDSVQWLDERCCCSGNIACIHASADKKTGLCVLLVAVVRAVIPPSSWKAASCSIVALLTLPQCCSSRSYHVGCTSTTLEYWGECDAIGHRLKLATWRCSSITQAFRGYIVNLIQLDVPQKSLQLLSNSQRYHYARGRFAGSKVDSVSLSCLHCPSLVWDKACSIQRYTHPHIIL